jgi:hypothetical protein
LCQERKPNQKEMQRLIPIGDREEAARKERSMSNDGRKRVLNRLGALELTPEETEKVVGAHISTRLSRIVTGTASGPDVTFDT